MNGDSSSASLAALGNLDGSGLSIHAERCVHVRNRHASCNRCADACTSGAISFDGPSFVIDPGKCVGCGTCATVCPTSAIDAAHPNDAVLLARATEVIDEGSGRLVLACRRCAGALDEPHVADAVCLSRYEESLLVELVSRGARDIVLMHGDCASCERRQGLSSAETVCATMKILIDTWHLPARVRLADAPEKALSAVVDEPINEGAGEAEPAIDLLPPHVTSDGTLPHFVPMRRNSLLDALSRFGEPEDTDIDTRLWGHVHIDERKCCSCRMCAVFCPTGALMKYGDDADGGVEHYAAECVHCLLCRDVCPESAITSESSVPARMLSEGRTERYPMAEPVWHSGPDQILQRMKTQIGGNEVAHSY